MTEVLTIVAAVLAIIWSAVVPKPRSYWPSIVTLIAFLSLAALAVAQWRYPDYKPDWYFWAICVILAAPVAVYLLVLWREKNGPTLNRLRQSDRHKLEEIVQVLRQMYLNGKQMAESLSRSVDANQLATAKMEVHKAWGFKAAAYLEIKQKLDIRLAVYVGWDIMLLLFYVLSGWFLPYAARKAMLLYSGAAVDAAGIGLLSIEGTKADLNGPLQKRLLTLTGGLRSNRSVNAVHECLAYAHAVNNLHLLERVNNPEGRIPSGSLGRYTAMTHGDKDKLMAQRFAKVADTIAKEYG